MSKVWGWIADVTFRISRRARVRQFAKESSIWAYKVPGPGKPLTDEEAVAWFNRDMQK